MLNFVFADENSVPLVSHETDDVQVTDEDSTKRLCGITVPSDSSITFTDFSVRLSTQVICFIDDVVVANGTLYSVRQHVSPNGDKTYNLSLHI